MLPISCRTNDSWPSLAQVMTNELINSEVAELFQEFNISAMLDLSCCHLTEKIMRDETWWNDIMVIPNQLTDGTTWHDYPDHKPKSLWPQRISYHLSQGNTQNCQCFSVSSSSVQAMERQPGKPSCKGWLMLVCVSPTTMWLDNVWSWPTIFNLMMSQSLNAVPLRVSIIINLRWGCSTKGSSWNAGKECWTPSPPSSSQPCWPWSKRKSPKTRRPPVSVNRDMRLCFKHLGSWQI